MKGQIMIIGIVIFLIIVVVLITMLASVIELLKTVALVVAAPFTFLWFWMFFTRKPIELDKYIAGGLSLVITVAVIAFIYTSWWAIVGLLICVAILWAVYKAVTNVSIMALIKGLI